MNNKDQLAGCWNWLSVCSTALYYISLYLEWDHQYRNPIWITKIIWLLVEIKAGEVWLLKLSFFIVCRNLLYFLLVVEIDFFHWLLKLVWFFYWLLKFIRFFYWLMKWSFFSGCWNRLSVCSFFLGRKVLLAAQIFALTLFDNKRNLKKFTEYVLKIYVVLNVVFYNEQNEEEEETNSSKVCLFKHDQLVFLENKLAKLH